MAIGLVGRKCGMTRVFTDAGESVPVTVIEVLPNRVTQVKTTEKDGYKATTHQKFVGTGYFDAISQVGQLTLGLGKV